MVEVTDVDHVNVLRWLAGCQDDPSRRHALQKAAAALTTAQAEIEALRSLLRECQTKMGDIVMGEGLHPDDAATLHAKIDATLAGNQP